MTVLIGMTDLLLIMNFVIPVWLISLIIIGMHKLNFIRDFAQFRLKFLGKHCLLVQFDILGFSSLF